MVAGAYNTTGDVLRAAFQVIGTAPGMKTVSSFFLMVFPDGRGFVFSDCGVNPNPNAKQLAEILKTAGTIVWNGPVGVFEFDQFGEGTKAISMAIAES